MFFFFFFFFNDTATTEIYTLSLHDALPISTRALRLWRTSTSRWRVDTPTAPNSPVGSGSVSHWLAPCAPFGDRKSTRLNSSHDQISYAVFCLKKKKKKKT